MTKNNHYPDIIVKHLTQHIPELQLVYLFGSAVSEHFTSSSDLDIAFLSKKHINSIEIWEIKESLADATHRDIDLIDLSQIHGFLKTEIISKGHVIYSLNEDFRRLYESRIIEDYVDWKDIIKPIEDQIRNSGIIKAY